MFEKKFNWKIYFFIVLFGATLLMAAYVVFLLATRRVADENGMPLPTEIIILTCAMLFLVCSTYAVTFVALLRQVIVHKNTAFRVDESGVHHTIVFVYVLAFVIVTEVEFIPWSAVHYIDTDQDGVYIRVRRNEVTATSVGKLILGLLGYHFCYSFTTKNMSEEEKAQIEAYCSGCDC